MGGGGCSGGSEGPCPLQPADSAGFPGRSHHLRLLHGGGPGLCLPLSWCDTEESHHIAWHRGPTVAPLSPNKRAPLGYLHRPTPLQGPPVLPVGSPCQPARPVLGARRSLLPFLLVTGHQVGSPWPCFLGACSPEALDLHYLHQQDSPFPSLLWPPTSDKRPAGTEGATSCCDALLLH